MHQAATTRCDVQIVISGEDISNMVLFQNTIQQAHYPLISINNVTQISASAVKYCNQGTIHIFATT
jgi:hypothetical protein